MVYSLCIQTKTIPHLDTVHICRSTFIGQIQHIHLLLLFLTLNNICDKNLLYSFLYYFKNCLDTWRYWNTGTNTHVPQPQTGTTLRMYCLMTNLEDEYRMFNQFLDFDVDFFTLTFINQGYYLELPSLTSWGNTSFETKRLPFELLFMFFSFVYG